MNKIARKKFCKIVSLAMKCNIYAIAPINTIARFVNMKLLLQFSSFIIFYCYFYCNQES